MIIPVYKPLGASSHQLAAKIGLARGEKATHTGTLDPLAEGVLIVVTGEDRFKKAELSDTEKTYEFEMLCGISTDSCDLLGLPTKVQTEQLNLEEITASLTQILPSFLGETEQTQPTFSAGRHAGKSFFQLAKSDESLPEKKNTISIHSLKLVTAQVISAETVLQTHLEKILLVRGDFRQNDILATWQGHANTMPKELPLFRFEASVSKRTYVRAIVRDLAKRILVPATTFSIVRTQNGQYSIADCIDF